MSASPARIAIVTGVSRAAGIGHACAARLAAGGYRVVGIDSAPPEPDTLWLQPEPPNGARFLSVDLTEESQITGLPGRLRSELGITTVTVDCLVNNAAIADPYLPSTEPGTPERAAAWRRFLAVNLTAPFLLTEALAPLMPRDPRRASVIHIASTRANQSEPHSEGYAASKAGLVGLTHAQAASLAGRARVNCVCPGWVDTSGDPGSLRPEDDAWHWTGAVGRPADVAEMVAFLADGSKSGFISGQSFVVDGGVTKRMVYPE